MQNFGGTLYQGVQAAVEKGLDLKETMALIDETMEPRFVDIFIYERSALQYTALG